MHLNRSFVSLCCKDFHNLFQWWQRYTSKYSLFLTPLFCTLKLKNLLFKEGDVDGYDGYGYGGVDGDGDGNNKNTFFVY